MEPIVTPAEMAEIDAAAPEPVSELIERAGGAVARAALDLLGGAYGRRVVVLAGKGNNGADGRAAARRLEARGVRCRIVELGGSEPAPAVLPEADLVIDAAYGTGFRGTFVAPQPRRPGTPVLAVDIPSGVSGLTGEASGEVLRAVRTVTFAALKPGLVLGDGPDLAGEVVVADIGLDVSSASAHRVEPDDVATWLPTKERSTHKWRAAVWVVAGSPGMTGAAHLATRAAQRAGAGYVRLSVPDGGADVAAPIEAVVVPVEAEWAEVVIDGAGRFGALAVGPGLGTGESAAAQVRAVVAGTDRTTVVDGDGLRALGRDAAAVIGGRSSVVLTPHDGEFEALVGRAPGPDRFAEVRALAAETGAVVLLKGPTTLVAHPEGRVLASTTGDARLATAGTGDVLTGVIVALAAQGTPPFEAAAAGAYLHGAAGHLACRHGSVAGDLLDHLPTVLTSIAGG